MDDLISRQAAIDAINSWRGRFSEEYNEAIDDCENSIKELSPAQYVATDTNVGDLISRQAALDAVEKNACNTQRIMDAVNNLPPAQPEVLACGNGELVAKPEPTDIDAREAVYNLAEKIGIHQLFALTVELRGEPIQPEPQWIPCSEKLPEEAGYYITSSEYGGVTVDFYYDHFWNSWKNAYKVLAWMPLPKIYKPNK